MPESNFLDLLAHPATLSPNLLSAYGQGQDIAGKVWQNRNALAAQRAGEAFQASINPDGTPNQPALNRNLAADPTAALAAQDSSQKGQTLDQGTFVTHMARLTAVSGAAMGLAAQYPDGVPQAAVNAEIDAQAPKLGLSPADVAQAKSQFGADPAANTATIFRNHAANLDAQQTLMATRPGATTINNGQGVTGATVGAPLAPNTGALAPVGGATPTYPSRADLNERVVTGYDPVTKAPIYGPKAAVTPPGLGGPAVAAPSPLGTGRPPLPAALRNPNAPGAAQPAAATPAAPDATGTAPPSAAAAAPATGIVTGAPGPAQTSALERTGSESATAFQGIADQGVKAQTQTAVLGNMLGDASLFTPGPHNDLKLGLQSFATSYAPKTAAAFGIDPKNVAANESFNKLGAQLADAQGAGSDARLSVNQAANPHAELTPAGIDLMLRQLQGNADYLGARSKLASSYADKSDRPGFEAQLGAKLDPRAFQFARMTVPQRATYVASLSKQDKAAVQSSYNYAHGAGLIDSGN